MLNDGQDFPFEITGIEASSLKRCSTCRRRKPLGEFTKNKSQKSGYMCYCKACHNKRNNSVRKDCLSISTACKRLHWYIKNRIRRKNRDLEFGPEFIEELYNLQNGRCAYTGDVLEIRAGFSNTMSVDRIDSSIGYTKDNIRLVTWEVNKAKMDSTMSDFVLLCKKVAKHGSH